VDADGDGYAAAEVEGAECGGTDCDDARPDVHPGAPTVCGDGVDQNCDGYVGETGALLEDVRLSECDCDSFYQDLAWTGSEFGVAWTDLDRKLVFRRVTRAGETLGGPVTVEVREPVGLWNPSIAWAGSGYGLAWHTPTGSLEDNIFFTRLDLDGAPGEILQLTDTGEGDRTQFASLVWTGSEFGMSYQSRWRDWLESHLELWFTRLSAGGARLMDDMLLMETPEDSQNSALVWTGSEFGVAWNDDREAFGDFDVFFTRVSAGGRELVDDLKVADGCASGIVCGPIPSVVWTGSEYALAWSSNQHDMGVDDVHLGRVSADGRTVIMDEVVTDSPTSSWHPDLAWTGSAFGLIWEQDPYGEFDLFFALLSPEGDPIGDVVRITDAPDYSWSPELAWSGDAFGVVWGDHRGSHGDVYFNVIVPCD
jgi:hypothetical protein